MKKPIIGILSSLSDEIKKSDDTRQMVSLALDYCRGVEKENGIPIVVPLLNEHSNIPKYLELCDGLLLAGGLDINPMMYREDPHTGLRKYSTKLDRFQLAVIDEALKREIPMLGVCRGHQLLNIAFGGTLYQDPSEVEDRNLIQHMQLGKESEAIHCVCTEEGSIIRGIIGKSHYVNSYHHQFIKKLGGGLIATAESRDGVVEAIEHRERPHILGVQWHPEKMAFCDEKMASLFRWIVEKSKSNMQNFHERS